MCDEKPTGVSNVFLKNRFTFFVKRAKTIICLRSALEGLLSTQLPNLPMDYATAVILFIGHESPSLPKTSRYAS